MTGIDIHCRQCGKPVEMEREEYATPVCFACLPQPKPLPVRKVRTKEDWLALVMTDCTANFRKDLAAREREIK